MASEEKPYYEMSFGEYATTAHSQSVPKWSILAVSPSEYSVSRLCRCSREQLRALAFLWGVNRDGSKEVLADRIIKRYQFRLMLSLESEESLSRRPRKELAAIAQQAGVYHPWLNRKEIAKQLVQWRSAGRERVRIEIAKARHEQIVRQAARRGLSVPPDNLEKYGLDAQGHYEPTVLGVPLSHASRVAPEAIAAAKNLSEKEFLSWVSANRAASGKLTLIEAGILGDGGALVWKSVQKVFAPTDVPPLFDGLPYS